MKTTNNEKERSIPKPFRSDFQIDWNWLYLRSHLVFAILVFIGMVFFVWWLTT